MPWNDNANPGPWGAPPPGDEPRRKPDTGPRREPPRRPAGPPPRGPGPDLNELLNRLRSEAERLLRGPGGRGVRAPAIWAIVALVALGWLLTGVFVVQPNEEGVITRFGVYSRSVEPGLHYHLPAPIEAAQLVSVTNQNKTVVGGSQGAQEPDESLMLTGDENIVDLSFTVQWHVSDAAKYLFDIRDPDAAVKSVAESAMRQVVGRNKLTDIITSGRGSVQNDTLDLMQRILDRYNSGVTVDAVQIQNANPPPEVVPAYQDIARAGQDAQSYINDANKYHNRVVNEAKGDAAKIIQAAEGYREQVIKEAQGQASRFDQLEAQYRRSPEMTRQRIYIETMQRILTHSKKVIVDSKSVNAPIILPPDLFRSSPPQPPEIPPEQQPQASQGQDQGQSGQTQAAPQ
ncbi:MAG TPA: FtsH protease activity modulator HflK [Caulobacteraceae bacterium]|jgi:membrane protease subunit HflK